MKPKRVKVFAPATISNLGPAFDILGIAINYPGDVVIAERTTKRGFEFSVEPGEIDLPRNARDNVAGHVAMLMLREFNPGFGIRMVLRKTMPIGSGLGSSGASSVASGVAVNALLPEPLSRQDLLKFAVEGERKASGSPHADNAAPCLLGGLCLVRSYNPLDVLRLPVNRRFIWIVVHPHVVVRTKAARAVLPLRVKLSEAVQQWGNVSGLTAGLITGNEAFLRKCMKDTIVEPARAHLIPGFDKVKTSAMRAGAIGCSIAGSGPSVFALTTSLSIAPVIARAMVRSFRRATDSDCELYISSTNNHGATIRQLR